MVRGGGTSSTACPGFLKTNSVETRRPRGEGKRAFDWSVFCTARR